MVRHAEVPVDASVDVTDGCLLRAFPAAKTTLGTMTFNLNVRSAREARRDVKLRRRMGEGGLGRGANGKAAR
jgi:hypothetical protein